MTYQEAITNVMTELAKEEKVVFIGEGIINAGRIYGTLNGVPKEKCVEMPIAENLIVGTAIGLAIEGYKPIVIFQRMDFMLCAADAIINHLSLIPKMSGDEVKLPVIIRAIIGSRDDKFDVGCQHNKDLTYVFKPYLHTVELKGNMKASNFYDTAWKSEYPSLIVEDRDLYNGEVK